MDAVILIAAANLNPIARRRERQRQQADVEQQLGNVPSSANPTELSSVIPAAEIDKTTGTTVEGLYEKECAN